VCQLRSWHDFSIRNSLACSATPRDVSEPFFFMAHAHCSDGILHCCFLLTVFFVFSFFVYAVLLVLYQGVWSRYFSTDETCSALEKPRMRSSVHFHLKVPVAVLFLTHMQHFQNTNGTRMIERDLTESEGHDYSFSLYWCGFG
jgi:hypothetical protein